MGKLIMMGMQKRRLLRPKRLQWSRFLFLLGMLMIGSTYQHLSSPQGLPSLWAAVSSQHPVKLASRDLLNSEIMTVSSDPPRASSEMEGETLAPQATVDKEEAKPGITMENTPNILRRTANNSPTVPKNNYSPTTAGTERVKENTPTTPSGVLNHYTPTSSRSTVKNYTPTTSRGEMKYYHPTQARGKVKKYTSSPHGRVVNSAPSTFTTMTRSHGITPRTTVKDSETMATYKISETSPSKGVVEETTPTTLKGITDNTPTFLINYTETTILTSRSTVEKNTLITPRRVDNNSSTNNLTASQGTALEHTTAISEGQVTISTMTGSSPAEMKGSTAAWKVRNPSSRTRAPTIGMSLATFWKLAKRPSTAPSTSAPPSVRPNPTTQPHCLVGEPAAAAGLCLLCVHYEVEQEARALGEGAAQQEASGQGHGPRGLQQGKNRLAQASLAPLEKKGGGSPGRKNGKCWVRPQEMGALVPLLFTQHLESCSLPGTMLESLPRMTLVQPPIIL